MFPAFEHCKLILIKAGQTSAGTDVDSDVIDTTGFEGVMVFGSIATKHADNFAKVAESATSGGSYADLTGSKLAATVNGNSFLIDIRRPLKPFLKVTIDRGGANTATGDMYALLYGPRAVPVSHGSTIESEQHISPVAGTA